MIVREDKLGIFKRSKPGLSRPSREQRGNRSERNGAITNVAAARITNTRSRSRDFLRDDQELQFDYARTSPAWIGWTLVLKEKIKVKKVVDGVEKEVEETIEKKRPAIWKRYIICTRWR